ncbi:MAG TPA: LamG-like jellyroll fold domain-containing protein [Chitinophagales bacterium]|nr:LamG-like jellyroll fold domain-containing protein [Chitinophagales bacterium]
MAFLHSKKILIIVLIGLCKICIAQNLTDSLIAYYPFDGNAVDESGNGHDGTISGATLVNDRFSNPASAYDFNGNGDYISVVGGNQFHPTSFPISVCCWIKSNSIDYTTGIFLNDFTPDVYTGIIFEVNPGNGGVLAISYGDGGPTTSTSRRTKLGTVFINDNQWHFVAAVIRGATDMDLYIDCAYDPGYYDGSGGSMDYTNNDGRLGMRDEIGSNYYYKGVIDDLRFYHRELTQTDLEMLYYTPIPYGIAPATVSLGNDTTLCSGTMVLNPTVTGTVQNYLWSDGSTDSTLIINQLGQYWVRVFDGCGISSDTINVIQCNPFSATDTSICEKFCIDFFDQSVNNPTSWYWIFNGGNPSTSTQQNPAQICYNLPGLYDVTLITSGANGIDTLTLHNYITVLATPSAPTITQTGYTLTSSYSSSYQWQLNAVDIPGATDQSYTVLQSGYYTVIVSNENGCVNSFTVYVLISGVDEIAIEGTSIFPNPAANRINIDLSGIKEPVSFLRITDDAGKVVMERKIVRRTPCEENENQKVKIDVSNFAAGIYFVEAITASRKFYSKFEVQK